MGEVSCFEDLMKALKLVPTIPAPVVHEIQYIWDWKSHVTNHFETPRLENHSLYHIFQCSTNGLVTKLNYKMWSSDVEWQPKTGIRLLKVDYDLSSLVKTAGFRIESLNLDKIVNDVLTKYIPTQPQVS